MKNLSTSTFFVLLLFAGLAFTACESPLPSIRGEGPVVSEQRPLDAFYSIKNSISADIYLSQGPQEDIRIEAQDNILANLNTSVSNGRLNIHFDEPVRSHKKVKVYITIPVVREVTVSGSGTVNSTEVLEGQELAINVSGSGEASMQVEMQEVEANVSGSGDIRLQGEAGRLRTRISGSGEVHALDMPVQEAEVYVSGSGDCSLDVSNRLDVQISGSGDVSYRGRPAISSGISGSGKLRSIQ